ncbi:phosphatidylinositol-binding clathrin assembly protein-like, partial [Trematomus bernacchii]|uniref:phosphatidylinositol-binding clathrin assembly protein-like n=1 Tax=Trematomus bernacchii TaxID=40690 RepID=UPI00146B4893
MSTFIRRYSRYLNEKAMSYRLVAVDFTKMKRGIDGCDAYHEHREADQDADHQKTPCWISRPILMRLTNGVINSAFMLLFKDSIRLFAAYNEGIINLLEKYFDM